MRKQVKLSAISRPWPLFFLGFSLAAIGAFFFWSSYFQPINPVSRLANAKVYYSPTCGCCSEYVRYLRRAGFEVQTIVNQRQAELIKNQHNIPTDLQSCHTAIIDDYVFEGHLPAEAIKQLLEERPELKGIALPGMPSGSPGMPGPKLTPFMIYGLLPDGRTDLYLSL